LADCQFNLQGSHLRAETASTPTLSKTSRTQLAVAVTC
jgi:hypothetical protein